MKNKLLLLLSLFYSLVGLSQADDISVTIDWANPIDRSWVFPVHVDSVNFYYAGVYLKGLLPLDEVMGKIRLDDLEREVQVQLEPEKIDREYPENLGFKVRGNELHGFYKHYDKKADINSILVRKVIDENGKSGEFRTLGTLESSKSYKANWDYQWSDNDSILMLVGHPELESKKDNEAIEFNVIDYNYDVLYECRIELDFQDRYFKIMSYKITNSGKIWMLGYKMPNRRKGEKVKKDQSNETYYLYVYDVDKEELIEYDLGLKDKYITNIDMRTDFENNKAVIYGIYSDAAFNAMAGSFYLSLDQIKVEVTKEKFNPFDKEFVKLMSNKKSDKKKVEKGEQEEIENKKVVLKEIVRKDDGGHLVVFENYRYWRQTYYRQNGSTQTTDYYQYNEIFVQNYTPDGDVIWTAFIPKKQHSTNDDGRYSGFLLLVNGNKLHFIYNDHIKNEERWGTDEEQKVVGFLSRKKLNLAMVTLSEDGDLSYKVLMPTVVEKFTICPRESKMIGKNSNKAIISGLSGADTRFGLLELIPD
jgi:hypothetical protein